MSKEHDFAFNISNISKKIALDIRKNKIVYIDDVNKIEVNKDLNLRCLCCDQILICKEGDINIKHFAHKINECEVERNTENKNNESVYHKCAKKIICLYLRLGNTLVMKRICSKCDNLYEVEISQKYCYVIEEYSGIFKDKEYRADIALIENNTLAYGVLRTKCLIEIKYKHSQSNRPEPWYEIDALEILEKFNDMSRVDHYMHLIDIRKDIICGEKKCYSVREIAKKLRYYELKENDKYNDLVIKFNNKEIKYSVFWNLFVDNKTENDFYYRILTEKEKCIKCGYFFRASFERVYCKRCYAQIMTKYDLIPIIENNKSYNILDLISHSKQSNSYNILDCIFNVEIIDDLVIPEIIERLKDEYVINENEISFFHLCLICGQENEGCVKYYGKRKPICLGCYKFYEFYYNFNAKDVLRGDCIKICMS